MGFLFSSDHFFKAVTSDINVLIEQKRVTATYTCEIEPWHCPYHLPYNSVQSLNLKTVFAFRPDCRNNLRSQRTHRVSTNAKRVENKSYENLLKFWGKIIMPNGIRCRLGNKRVPLCLFMFLQREILLLHASSIHKFSFHSTLLVTCQSAWMIFLDQTSSRKIEHSWQSTCSHRSHHSIPHLILQISSEMFCCYVFLEMICLNCVLPKKNLTQEGKKKQMRKSKTTFLHEPMPDPHRFYL